MSDYHPDRDTLARDMAREIAREEIQKALASPIDFPQELKNWIPGITAIAGLQIPASDIVGLYTVSTTVSGLGPGFHGRVGMVRAGTDPFEFIHLTYDEPSLQWVSDSRVIGAFADTGTLFSTTNTTYTTVTPGPVEIWHNLVDMDTAGLKPQFRLRCYLSSGSAGVAAYAHVRLGTANVGDTGTSVHDPPAAGELTSTNTSSTYCQSDWYEYTSLAIKDIMRLVLQIKATSPTSASISQASTLVRWVSQ